MTEVADYAGRPNVVGVWKGTGGGRSMILNAHIDTVEAGDRAHWQHEPLGAEVVGDRYGRGSCDMKAGQIANQYAVRICSRLTSGCEVMSFSGTISEEDDDAGIGHSPARVSGRRPLIITEPTELAVIPAQGGSLMFRIDVPSRSAHATTRNEGVSAFEKAAVVLNGLLAWERERNESIDHPLYRDIENKIPINVGTVRSGMWRILRSRVRGDGRTSGFGAGKTCRRSKSTSLDRISSIAAADDWLRDHPPAVTFLTGQFAAAGIPLDAPVLTTLASAHKSVTGDAPDINGVTYGADMRHFIHAGRLPCVMYGPGDVRVAHRADEFVPISEVLSVAATLAITLCTWCGVAG
ncbi:MAG: M20/M25/M40 family metallo-hydrolase [Thermomicrobiales bacterium]